MTRLHRYRSEPIEAHLPSGGITVASTDDRVELSKDSDTALVVAVGRWSEPALAETYRRHGGAVHGLARRILGGDGRADEITQEVFVDLWARPERFDSTRGSLRAYLLTVTHGRAVDLLRADTARAAREHRSAIKVATSGYDLENQVWDLAVADRVKQAVGDLPDSERQAIELAYFGGHTYREVAGLLNKPEGTIKARIRRGLRRLHTALVEEMEPTWNQP